MFSLCIKDVHASFKAFSTPKINFLDDFRENDNEAFTWALLLCHFLIYDLPPKILRATSICPILLRQFLNKSASTFLHSFERPT